MTGGITMINVASGPDRQWITGCFRDSGCKGFATPISDGTRWTSTNRQFACIPQWPGSLTSLGFWNEQTPWKEGKKINRSDSCHGFPKQRHQKMLQGTEAEALRSGSCFTSLSIYLSTYLSIYPSVYLSIHQSIYQSINQSIYQSIYLSIYLSIIYLFGHSWGWGWMSYHFQVSQGLHHRQVGGASVKWKPPSVIWWLWCDDDWTVPTAWHPEKVMVFMS